MGEDDTQSADDADATEPTNVEDAADVEGIAHLEDVSESADLHRGEYRWGGSAAKSLVALLVLAAAGWLVIRPDFSRPAVSRDESVLVLGEARSAPTTSSTTLPASTTTAAVDPFTKLPAGLSCKELRSWGGTYEDAVRYWNRTGQPEALDPDANGAPCETSFTKNDVIAVLGTIPPESGSTTTTSTTPGTRRPEPPAVANLPGGLNCGQLRSRGYGSDDAVAYYLAEGRPSRMDADGNGIPCETIFSDAAAAWRRR